jgi:bleomycin hydrolase
VVSVLNMSMGDGGFDVRSRLYRFVILAFLTGVGPFTALPAYGAESCQGLFSPVFSQGELNGDLHGKVHGKVHDDLAENTFGTLKSNFNHNSNYKVEVRDQSEIKNQCGLGTCHLHSWVSQLEHQSIRDELNIKISTHYLVAMHWLHSSLEKLDTPYPADTKVNLGAGMFASRKLILTYGVIPDAAWTGSRDFQKEIYSKRIEEYIGNVLARTKWKAAREADPKKQKALIENGKAEIRGIFKNLVGELPLTFSYDRARFTPHMFLNTYFPEMKRPMVQMLANEGRKDKNEVEATGSYVLVKTNLDQIEKTARELLDKGLVIYVSYEHNAQFVDSTTGIMSIGAFNFPHSAAPLSREQRDYFGRTEGGHAVQIVGYDLNPKTGKVIKWKMKNSWGEAKGDGGYYHMYNDYFRAFIKSISFFKDAMIKLPANEVVEESGPAQLNLF